MVEILRQYDSKMAHHLCKANKPYYSMLTKSYKVSLPCAALAWEKNDIGWFAGLLTDHRQAKLQVRALLL